jgi:GxxExxY protein
LMPYDEEIPPHGNYADVSEELNLISREVIGAAIEVHRELGPGMPEEAYMNGMAIELSLRNIPFEREKRVDIMYKGTIVAKGRIDLLVEGKLVVEAKCVEAIGPVHRLQTLKYMRILKQPLGLLINFNVPLLKLGIKRIIDTQQSQ